MRLTPNRFRIPPTCNSWWRCDTVNAETTVSRDISSDRLSILQVWFLSNLRKISLLWEPCGGKRVVVESRKISMKKCWWLSKSEIIHVKTLCTLGYLRKCAKQRGHFIYMNKSVIAVQKRKKRDFWLEVYANCSWCLSFLVRYKTRYLIDELSSIGDWTNYLVDHTMINWVWNMAWQVVCWIDTTSVSVVPNMSLVMADSRKRYRIRVY